MISSSGDGSRVTTYGETANTPWETFYNDDRSYVLCTVTPETWHTEYRVVETVREPDSPASTVESFVVENGNPGTKLAPVESRVDSTARMVGSQFETDDEGWRLVGDPEQRQPTYATNDGSRGGYTAGKDKSTGATWYYSAPDKLVGEKSGFSGGTLTFDLKQSRTDN